MYYYILCFLFILCLVVYIYAKLKYGFWIIQPVFHMYNIGYMIYPPGIIDSSLPIENKYTNVQDIQTIEYFKLSPYQKTVFVQFIKSNYLNNHDNIFSPVAETIFPYFVGHNDKSLFSFYYEKVTLVDSKLELITDNKIIGAITSRPIHVTIFNYKQTTNTFQVYYVDYLCVDKAYRKKGIAPQLIQTHNYNQRHANSHIVVSLFKREDELTGIVPLCAYSTYGFQVTTWSKPPNLSGQYTLLEINSHNYRFVYDFIATNANQFDIYITVDMANILSLINSKNIFVYAILCDNQIRCCYFYRKSCVQIQDGLEVLSCFSSICNCEEDLFIQGFKISFWKISAENNFGFCAIENISHNNIIIDNISLKTPPYIISPTAYFFYNFAYPSFHPSKTFIIT
jgi:hypothetical protein